MRFDRLIAESQALEDIAAKIQAGEQVGLPEVEIKALVERYHDWYTDCLAILPDDLKTRFRSEYEGTWHSFKVKRFLEAPTKPSVLHQADEKKTGLFSYWQHPYETSFRGPILAQRQMLLEASKRPGAEPGYTDPIVKVELLARRFHVVARQLLQRHNRRPTIEVTDEYDVQDLFHGLLKLFFDDVRPEETTPSYAGGSSRIDYLLKDEQVVIEIKKTRPNLKTREVRDQLIIDISSYRSHPDCKTLIAFVYDPDMYIDNPKALENDLSRVTDGMTVKVIVAQR